MRKAEFDEYYENVIMYYGRQFIKNNKGYHLIDDSQRVFEEYLNQKACMKLLMGKQGQGQLLDRHKVCAAMTVAILKARIIVCDEIDDFDGTFGLEKSSKINEQLAFYSGWTLMVSFLESENLSEMVKKYKLPETSHNSDFGDTFARSLFFANAQNSLSPELIANIYFLLEKYNECIC